MIKFYLSSSVAVLAAFSLAACSGHSMGQVLPGTGSSESISQPGSAFQNGIEDADGTDKAAAPNVFIKLNKGSVPKGSVSVTVILTKVGSKAVKPPKKKITNLTKCSAGCSVPGPTSAAGKDTFTVSVFTGKNGKGKLLRFGTVTGKVKATTTTLKAKTLFGNVASAVVTVSPAGKAGTASTATVTIAAKDAAANAITGTYYKPITVTDGDTSGATTLTGGSGGTTLSRTITSSTQGVKLNYTGLAITSATLTPGGTGVTGTPGTFTVSGATIVAVISPVSTVSASELDLYATSGTGSSGTVTASEAGWTNSPFNQTITFTIGTSGGNCAGGTVASFLLGAAGSNLNAKTVSANPAANSNAGPNAGSCTLTLTGGGGATFPVKVTYTTTGIGINGKHQ
jgi:hypothetical protein